LIFLKDRLIIETDPVFGADYKENRYVLWWWW